MSKVQMPDEELLKSYEAVRARGSSRELAELEGRIYAQAHKTKERLGDRRIFFQERFGGKTSGFEARATVYHAGPWAFPLFDRLDRGVKATTVMRQLRAARNEADANGTNPGEVLQRILSSGEKTTPAPRRKSRTVHALVPSKTEPMHIASRQFRTGVEALAESFMDSMFKNVADEIKNQLVADFRMSLGQLLDEFRVRAVKTKASAKAYGLKRIGVDRFNWACEVFGIKTKFGQYLNIKWVGRLKIRRLRDLHSDRNPSEQARHEYDAVNEAYEILRMYASQVTKTKGKADDEQE